MPMSMREPARSRSLGLKPARVPRPVAASPEFDAVVEAIFAALPEFHRPRADRVASPGGRQGNLARRAPVDVAHEGFELGARPDLLPLGRGGPRELAATRTRAPVGQRLLIGQQ